jgi:hypothetical protein
MRSFFLKGLFLLATLVTGCAYAAVDTQQVDSKTVVTQQAVDNLPIASNQAPTIQSTSTSQKTPAESIAVTADTLPVQVAMVSGDYHKYEALNWQNRGYSGGVKDLSIHYTSGDDVTIDASGGAIMGNGDYKGAYSIAKKDVGYMNFDFNQFRKYYDTYGGIFQGRSYDLSRDLFLDIGHFGFETGITNPDYPNVSVYYDHDYKNGSKSMLNWDAAMVGGASKKISPSWEEIDETTDTFGVKGDYTEKGYHLTGDQRWEISRWKTRGYEQRLNTDNSFVSAAATPAGKAVDIANQSDQRIQDQVQETDVMTTTLGADKWYWKDKAFGSSAFRFEHLKNEDRQNIQEFKNGVLSLGTINSTTGALTATSASFNKPDASAHNQQDLSSWVLNLMVSPWNCLSGTGGFKAEVSQRDASSYYPNDTTAPIGTVDSVLKNNTDSNTYKFSESFGLRFKAIPRTAIYSDLSFEQSQNHMLENQITQIATAAPVSRDAIVSEPAITWVTGADFQPMRFINLTSQFHLRDKGMDFNDRFRVSPVQGLVFLEKLHTANMGFTQRATAHICSWAQASFRYLFDNTDYTTRAVYNTEDEKANVLSNTFIYDATVFPLPDLSMTGSFSQIYSQTKTVASASSFYMQPFNSNSSTWMLATDYQAHKKVHLDSSLFYTLANNYGNTQNTSLVNYAAAFNQLGLTVGCKWDLTKDLSVKPQYSFQRYLPNENSGIGGAYDAQIISLQVITTWG